MKALTTILMLAMLVVACGETATPAATPAPTPSYEDLAITVVGWIVHFLFMLMYWTILSSPIWLIVWLVVDRFKESKKEKASRR